MGPFEYFIILIVIIIGLALESVAKNLDGLLAAGKRVRWNWMAPANALGISVQTIAQFWLLWQLRDHYKVETFLFVLPPVAAMVVLFLAASAALPSEVPEQGLDLKLWYFQNCTRYWGLIVALAVAFAVTDLVVYFTHAMPAMEPLIFLGQNAIVAALAVSLMRTRSPWWHGFCIVLFLVVQIGGNAALRLT
ncbi:MAG TPA: hypothetical protein VHW02_01155 [Rhizomicrobium sp.]|jgi:hypothetical protein|nr:hypothetical protein [Rhizomicrobium sp.]